MKAGWVSRLTHPPRSAEPAVEPSQDLEAFVDSRALEYPTKLEDAFVERVLKLGVENGVLLDVGTGVGLIPLKILWQKENFLSIGVDASAAMIEQARATATAWELEERAFFQVGDARKMRLKSHYFDLVVSDGVLHRLQDPLSVLSEIGRVVKPRGGILIRDVSRPNRFRMAKLIESETRHYGSRMRAQVESGLRTAYTAGELREMVKASGLQGANVVQLDELHMAIERQGTTDPNSWVSVREQYR